MAAVEVFDKIVAVAEASAAAETVFVYRNPEMSCFEPCSNSCQRVRVLLV